MKKFRKLIPALCMLLVSALFVGTSTYAWFSMNKTVTATDMKVTAKSNSTYLLIGDDENAPTIQAAKTTTVKASAPANTTLYPTFYGDGTTDLSMGEATQVGKWYTANSTAYDNATTNTENAKLVNDGELGDYVAEYKVWLTLSKDSDPVSKQIKVTLNNRTDADDAIKAVVKVGDTDAMQFATLNQEKTTSAAVALNSTQTDLVTIQVYIDGTSTNVNSQYFNENTGKLAGTLGFKFDLVD